MVFGIILIVAGLVTIIGSFAIGLNMDWNSGAVLAMVGELVGGTFIGIGCILIILSLCGVEVSIH